MSKYLIIGATGGIGQAVCQALIKNGDRVTLTGRNDVKLTSLKERLGEDCQTLVVDINSICDRKLIIETLNEQGINKVINISGINQFMRFADQSDMDIEKILQTNLTSIICLNRMLVAHFLKQGSGLILNTGSTLGQIGLPGYASYSATKFGLRGFCEALSRELADSPVEVKYFSPRATYTSLNTDEVNDMNQELGASTDTPEKVASQLIYFLESSANYYQVGWPEKIFSRLNGAFPTLVSMHLKQQLPVVNKFLKG